VVSIRLRAAGISAALALVLAAWGSTARARFQVGVTHEHHTLDAGGDAAAIARATVILRSVGPLQNQSIMGWGAGNPEPSPGHYDWASLDRRMALIRATHGVPVITLCCAPDWMKGGRAGHTDWNRLAVAPSRRHFDEFARLAVAVARRYRSVRHYQVWNELKGFWNYKQNRWDYEGYTALYNQVYDSLKRVDRSLRIGGPYVPMDSLRSADAAGGKASDVSGPWGVIDQRALDAVTYWLAHKHGADFISIDGGTDTRDGYFPPPAQGAQKFAAVTRWLRARTTLPIWWSEFYAPKDATGASTPAAISDALVALRDSGASVALLWSSECQPGDALPCLWTSTFTPAGGRPTPYLQIIRAYRGLRPQRPRK
jgi:hypothetical protein